jgi:hypothetical protein
VYGDALLSAYTCPENQPKLKALLQKFANTATEILVLSGSKTDSLGYEFEE